MQKKRKDVKNHRELQHKYFKDEFLRRERIYQYCYRRELIESKLHPCEDLRELYEGLKADDLYQKAIDQLKTISQLWRDPLIDLPSAHAAVEEELCDLRAMLESRPADGLHSPRDILLLHVQGLARDQGGWMADDPFSSIGHQAHELQEAWRMRGDMHNLTGALYVNAELWRQRFFATQDDRRFWKRAFQEVEAGGYVASLYKGAYQRLSTFLDFYAWQAQITLLLDIDTPDLATSHIHALPDRAKKVTDVWGEGSPVSEVTLFLASMQQALYYLSRKDPAEAEKHYNDAEKMWAKPMQWRPVSEQQAMAFINASLALAKGAPAGEQLVQDYRDLWSRNPSFEQKRNLERLKKSYSIEPPKGALSNDMPIYVETCFNFLQPLLLPYTDAARGGGKAISQAEEGGDGMYPTVKN